MKCSIMLHFIWVFTDCQSICEYKWLRSTLKIGMVRQKDRCTTTSEALINDLWVFLFQKIDAECVKWASLAGTSVYVNAFIVNVNKCLKTFFLELHINIVNTVTPKAFGLSVNTYTFGGLTLKESLVPWTLRLYLNGLNFLYQVYILSGLIQKKWTRGLWALEVLAGYSEQKSQMR